MTPEQLAADLHSAHLEGRLLDSAQVRTPQPWDLTAAYAVQDELTSVRLASGRHVIGWKLGYTSAAMRAQMGVQTPNYGPLLDDMVIAGTIAHARFTHPRVEPEIAVVLGTDLAGSDLSLRQVAEAVSQVRAALEVVDSVWRDYRFTAELNTADGSSAAGVVIGDVLDVDPFDCDAVTVELRVDGEAVATAQGSAASGHPLLGIAWLCQAMAARGVPGLRAGQTIITGGLTAAVPLGPGGSVTAAFSTGAGASVENAADVD